MYRHKTLERLVETVRKRLENGGQHARAVYRRNGQDVWRVFGHVTDEEQDGSFWSLYRGERLLMTVLFNAGSHRVCCMPGRVTVADKRAMHGFLDALGIPNPEEFLDRKPA